MAPTAPYKPYDIHDAGIDEARLSVHGHATDLLIKSIRELPPAERSMPILTDAGTIELVRLRSRYFDDHQGGGIQRYDYLSIQLNQHPPSAATLSWHHLDDLPHDQVALELRVSLRRVTQRFGTSDDLLRFLSVFIGFDSLDDIVVRQLDYYIDRIVPTREHHQTICLDRRFKHERREWEPGSRQFGARSSGVSRDYNKQLEMDELHDEVYVDPDLLPPGCTVQRTEASCGAQRLKRVLGLERNTWLLGPDKRVKLWHLALPPLGKNQLGPFYMFRRLRLREDDLRPNAKHRAQFDWFRSNLDRVGLKEVYDFAAQHGIVKTWFVPLPFAQDLLQPLLEHLDRFLLPLRNSVEVEKLFQDRRQRRWDDE